jgi:hypothetical protein
MDDALARLLAGEDLGDAPRDGEASKGDGTRADDDGPGDEPAPGGSDDPRPV